MCSFVTHVPRDSTTPRISRLQLMLFLLVLIALRLDEAPLSPASIDEVDSLRFIVCSSFIFNHVLEFACTIFTIEQAAKTTTTTTTKASILISALEKARSVSSTLGIV